MATMFPEQQVILACQRKEPSQAVNQAVNLEVIGRRVPSELGDYQQMPNGDRLVPSAHTDDCNFSWHLVMEIHDLARHVTA